MNEFRTRVCPHYATALATAEGDADLAMRLCPCQASRCFDSHARVPRRRKPQLQNGRWNYIPTRCRYVLEDSVCPQGVHCRFAHCTEEVIYHPSKYKTQLHTHHLNPFHSFRPHTLSPSLFNP
eukprot:GABV01007894.1.p1 GENE.GABV01007894.1~~GABV01007894.1.p1  ORF type:complete len:123 (-),score=21.58 GABV01007894.1:32-400(-)